MGRPASLGEAGRLLLFPRPPPAPMDPSRFQQLLDEREWMRRLALHLTGEEHVAADLVQDTWVRLLRRPPGGRGPVRAWIYTVMANLNRNRFRGTSRRRQREEVYVRHQETESVADDRVVLDEAIEQLRQALHRLPAAQREVVYLHYFRDMRPREIADALGQTPAAVRQRLWRARESLRADLDTFYGDRRDGWCPLLLAFGLRGAGAAGPTEPDALAAPLSAGASTAALGVLVTSLAVGTWWVVQPRAEVGAAPPTIDVATASSNTTLPQPAAMAEAPLAPARPREVPDAAAPASNEAALVLAVFDEASGAPSPTSRCSAPARGGWASRGTGRCAARSPRRPRRRCRSPMRRWPRCSGTPAKPRSSSAHRATAGGACWPSPVTPPSSPWASDGRVR